MKKICITGGIGSGKSTFVYHLNKKNFKTHDADAVVKNIYKKPPTSFVKLLQSLGLVSAIRGKKINTKNIANVIFSNKNKRRAIEKYIHKHVRRERKKFIINQKKKRNKTAFFDIPLVFESKLTKEFDIIVSILCPKKLRFKRVNKRTGISETLFNNIVKTQTTNKIRKKKSNYCITNDKTKKIFIKKIDNFLKKIGL